VKTISSLPLPLQFTSPTVTSTFPRPKRAQLSFSIPGQTKTKGLILGKNENVKF
jgi:hypothetical protein